MLAALGVGLAACGSDVLLAEPDPDAGLALTSGAYELSFGHRLKTDCVGEFADRAGAFDELDASATGLVGGRVDLAVLPDAVHVAGAPIAEGFEEPELVLTRGDLTIGEALPGTVLASVPI